MSPIGAFKQAIFYISSLCSQRMLDRPGAVIEKLSADARRALKELKSSDLDGTKERIDSYCIGSENYYQNKKFQEERFQFDKKISKDIPTFKKY